MCGNLKYSWERPLPNTLESCYESDGPNGFISAASCILVLLWVVNCIIIASWQNVNNFRQLRILELQS